MSITPIWIDLTATDARAARDFYADLFGWQVEVDESMDYGLLSDGDGPPAGGIGQEGDHNQNPTGLVVYFPVEDVDAALRRAKGLGADVAIEPWEIDGLGRMAVFIDPAGNRVGLMSR